MTCWHRPPGPLNVWKVVDGYERLSDGTQKRVKFSIQEIPNENRRKDELYELMMKYYLIKAPYSKYDNMPGKCELIEDFRRIFEFAVNFNISVGCYKLDSDGKIEELVGANLLFIATDNSLKEFKKLRSIFKSKNYIKIYCDLQDRLTFNADPFEIFQTDKYISSAGLCVKSAYRGQSLGYHILKARNAIGKKYEIYATSAVFSSTASQIQAERAGFKELRSIDIEDFFDDQGNSRYCNIESKTVKFMIKGLP